MLVLGLIALSLVLFGAQLVEQFDTIRDMLPVARDSLEQRLQAMGILDDSGFSFSLGTGQTNVLGDAVGHI